jgi:hypothetical protein
MKPYRVFIYFLGLFICLLFLDWLKASSFLVQFHSIITPVKNITLVVGGMLIMKYTLSPKAFKNFCFVYAFLWLIYILIRLSFHKAGNETAGSNKALMSYLHYTQLLTILPFIIYWFIVKAFENNEQNEASQK